MEDLKTQMLNYDTASSDGFPQISSTQSKMRSTTKDCISSQKFQRGNIQQLILKLKQCIECNNIIFQKIHSNDQLKTYLSQTLQELNILKAQIDGKTLISKQQFQQQMNQLQRLINSIKKQWKEFKQRQQKMIILEMEQLKSQKKQNEKSLTKLLKDTNLQIKCKFAKFAKQLKQFKKNRSEKKNNFFNQIQRIRGLLDQNIEYQRKKRTQYEQIILNLLDKTCDQGERILRRIC